MSCFELFHGRYIAIKADFFPCNAIKILYKGANFAYKD